MSTSPSRSASPTGRIATSSTAGLATGRLRLVVDLGPLQAAAEVDIDRLPLGERVERGVAGLAVAVAGLLPTAERQVRLGTGGAGIHVHDSGLEIAHRSECRVRVLGEDRGAQAVAGLVDGCR